MTPLVIPLPGNERLAEAIADVGGFELGTLETRHFPDGESYVRHRSDVSGRSVALVCTLNDPDPRLMPLLLAAASAREHGAYRVGLVAPYLAYMRQDRAFRQGEAISAVHFARILSREIDWLVTIDPHLHRIPRLDQIFTVACAALHAEPLLAEWIRSEITDPLLIGPDAESEQWVAAAAKMADAPYVVASKVRSGDRAVEITVPDLSRWRERTPVLVDDVVSTGRTLLASVEILNARGMHRPACAVIHGIFASDAFARLSSVCSPIVTCNTVQHVTNGIDVGGLLAKAVTALASG